MDAQTVFKWLYHFFSFFKSGEQRLILEVAVWCCERRKVSTMAICFLLICSILTSPNRKFSFLRSIQPLSIKWRENSTKNLITPAGSLLKEETGAISMDLLIWTTKVFCGFRMNMLIVVHERISWFKKGLIYK